MTEYFSYIPRREGNSHFVVPLLLFVIGFTAMIASAYAGSARLPLQLLCLIFVVAGIQLTTRYALCFYEYVIFISETGEGFLRVIRLQGKYRSVVCDAPLECAVGAYKGKSPDMSEYSKNIPVFSFCVNMFAQRTVTVLFDGAEAERLGAALPHSIGKKPEYTAVKLEWNSGFLNALGTFTEVKPETNKK